MAAGGGVAGVALFVTSGLIGFQFTPPSLVASRNCVPRYSVCGSVGEKPSGGFVAIWYMLSPRITVGETVATWRFVRSMRTTPRLGPPAYTRLLFSGSGTI